MLEPGQIVDDKYRVTCQLGVGGMASVYEAQNLRIRSHVAIKVLHTATRAKPELIQRFEREAQAAGQIGNDHIVEVYDLGRLKDGSPFMVMERLVGETLSDRIARMGQMAPTELAPLVIQTLEGLEAAHGAGIVHRDLKPSNLFIVKEKAGRRDFVKIIDFGISKFQEFTDPDFTSTGVLLGSPNYIAPEQADSSRHADARSDLYSLGVIMYKAVSGQAPFDAGSLREVLVKIMLSSPPPLSEVVQNVDPTFERIVARTMSREPSFRYQSAKELREALVAWTEGRPVEFASHDEDPTVTDAPLAERAGRPAGAPRERSERTSTAARSWSRSGTRGRERATIRAVALGVGGACLLFLAATGIYLALRPSDPTPAPAAAGQSVKPDDDVRGVSTRAKRSGVMTPDQLDEAPITPDELEKADVDAGRKLRRTGGYRRVAPTPAPAAAPAEAPAPPAVAPPTKGGVDWGY